MNYAPASECDNCDDGMTPTGNTCTSCATSLIEAVRSEDSECVSGIIEYGIDGNPVDVNEVESASGNTALHEAAATGRLDIVEALLINGADVNQINLSGLTALDHGSTESVRQALIDAGAV